MSGTGPQLAPSDDRPLPRSRSRLAYLLHALNQPLTGLQCSLELAAAGPARRPEQYLYTLREALQLAGRMRVLVEAIRELAEIREWASEEAELFFLEEMFRETVDELLPVAQANGVQLSFMKNAELPVRSNRRILATFAFRLLESILSLTRRGSSLRVAATPEQKRAGLRISWNQAAAAEHSPFSRQELGLLIAQEGWERIGAECFQTQAGDSRTLTLWLPLACTLSACEQDHTEK